MLKFIAILRSPWLAGVYLLILLLWMIIFFYSQGSEFLELFSTSKPTMIFLAILAYFATAGIITPYLHSIAYKQIGITISFGQAFRIFNLSNMGNYLPGRVWSVFSYYLFSKKMNIGTEKIAKNIVVLKGLAFIVGSVCSLPIITFLSPSVQKVMIIFPFLMLLLIHPKILNKIFNLFFHNEDMKDFRYIFLVKVSMFYLMKFIILGISLYFCVLTFESVAFSNLPLMVVAAASSLIIGLLVMAVLAFRMVMVLVDISCAGISALSIASEEKNFPFFGDKSIKLLKK